MASRSGAGGPGSPTSAIAATGSHKSTPIELVHAFGVQASLRSSLCFQSDSDVLYVVGRHVCMHNLDSKHMFFIPQTPNTTKLTAMAVDPMRRYLAMCEQVANDSGATVSQVTVVDLRTAPAFRRVRTLINPFKNAAGLSSDLVCIAFSGDSKYLIVQTGTPDWITMVWSWFQSRLECHVEVPARVTCVSFNPSDPTQVCTSGPGHMRLWRFIDESLKPFPPFVGLKGTESVTAHSWTKDDRLVAVTKEGTVLIIEDCELRQFFPTVNATRTPVPLSAIVTFSNGMIVGGDNGLLTVFDTPESISPTGEVKKPLFRLIKPLNVEMSRNPVSVRGLSMSPSGEMLSVFVDGGLGTINMAPLWLQHSSDATAHISYLTENLHTGSINGLDVCQSRFVFATCSDVDRTVRIWDYDTKKVSVVHSCESPPLAVSMHPSGFMILVVLSGRVIMYHILSAELKPAVDIAMKGASLGRFSVGGGMFAVVCLKNIVLYSTFGPHGPVLLGTFSGHVGQITSIEWLNHDATLLSASADGAVYKWDVTQLAKGIRSAEAPVVKAAKYTCLVAGHGVIAGAYQKLVSRKRSSTPATAGMAVASAPAPMSPQGSRRTVRPSPGGGGGAVPATPDTHHGAPHHQAPHDAFAASSRLGTAASTKHSEDDPPPRETLLSRGGTASENTFALVGWHDDADMNTVMESGMGCMVSCLQLSEAREGLVLWGGMETGDIAELSWPLNGVNDVLVRHGTHAGIVTCMKLSPDGCFLFSTSTDGSIFMTAMTERVDTVLGQTGAAKATSASMAAVSAAATSGAKRQNNGELADKAMGDVLTNRKKALESLCEAADILVLVPHLAIAEATYRVKQMEDELREQRAAAEMKGDMERARAAEELQRVQVESQAEKHQAERLLNQEKQDKAAQKKDLEEKLAEQETKQVEAMEQLSSLYERKLALQTAKMEDLRRQFDNYKTAAELRMVEISSSHDSTQQRMLDQFKDKVEAQRKAHADLKAYLEYVQSEYNGMLVRQDQEHDREVLDLKAKMATLESELDKTRSKLRSEQVQLLNTIGTLKEGLEKSSLDRSELEKRRQDEVAKRAQIVESMREMEAEVATIRNVLAERDTQLGDAHRKIRDLERSRRVLQQQLQDLRATLHPHETQVGALKDQIRELDAEYERGSKVTQKQEQALADRQLKIETLNKRLKETMMALATKEQTIARVSKMIDVIVRETPPAKWRAALTKLQNEAFNADSTMAPVDTEPQEDLGETALEFTRQRQYLERSVRVLENKAHREEMNASRSTLSRMSENGALLVEVNLLRRENKDLAARTVFLEGELNALQSRLRLDRRAGARLATSAPSQSEGGGRTLQDFSLFADSKEEPMPGASPERDYGRDASPDSHSAQQSVGTPGTPHGEDLLSATQPVNMVGGQFLPSGRPGSAGGFVKGLGRGLPMSASASNVAAEPMSVAKRSNPRVRPRVRQQIAEPVKIPQLSTSGAQ